MSYNSFGRVFRFTTWGESHGPALGAAVTGECLHVDAGYHVVGMKAEDAPDIAVNKTDGA